MMPAPTFVALGLNELLSVKMPDLVLGPQYRLFQSFIKVLPPHSFPNLVVGNGPLPSQ